MGNVIRHGSTNLDTYIYSNTGKGHKHDRSRRGHAPLQEKTPTSIGSTLQRRCHKKGPKFSPTHKFC